MFELRPVDLGKIHMEQHMEIFRTGNGKEFENFLNLAQYMLVKKYVCMSMHVMKIYLIDCAANSSLFIHDIHKYILYHTLLSTLNNFLQYILQFLSPSPLNYHLYSHHILTMSTDLDCNHSKSNQRMQPFRERKFPENIAQTDLPWLFWVSAVPPILQHGAGT